MSTPTKLAGASLVLAALVMDVNGGRGELVDRTRAERRFAGSHGPPVVAASATGDLDVATLNIQFARRIDRARELFARVAELARADLVLLQEMDGEGTEELAASLRMNYVYYPATVHPRTGRDFGNAVLSRWPIAADRKITLPHPSLYDGTRRSATCATVAAPFGPIEVCSVHLATRFELLPWSRRAQMRAVLERLSGAPRAIVAGDLNSYGLGKLALAEAFDWATHDIGRTVGRISADHIFARGLRARQVGRVTDTLGATDHAAVWARLGWQPVP